ncbi:threonine--tRNA ligase [Bacillus sp. Marseille-Q1617]|uniref:threonine--tRNA ligase n=1 Tax=Bacillus sp. Marseille-Q1617 TaxID=2736887 RepID=UPI00158E286F|nr:threonine--tRNA ligase [Bacillus sp. Marseille-Q1617]
MSVQFEAEKRNHRKLGAQLELFMSMEEAPGMPFFLPKGMVIRNELERFWKEEHRKAGYEEIKTPVMMKQELWEQSGHWLHYHENMYFSNLDDQSYAIKPMNCPGAVLIYKSKRRSYRELPIRYGELGLVHRHEFSGSLSGLLRVRSFTQDDAHLFVLENQVQSELNNVLDLIDVFYSKFGFQYKIELSTRPDEYMGSIEMWNKAEEDLEKVLQDRKADYQINEGDGAFYGPKIDFHLVDSIGRSWQCGTVQLDFQMPEKFNCEYIGEDNKVRRPIMIHRAIYGSIERFMAILIEHYEGNFPLWLAPVQIKVLPISQEQVEYALKVKRLLEDKGIRVEIDDRNEKIGYKIRQAQMEKVPHVMVVGNKEIEGGNVSLRNREGKSEVINVEKAIQSFMKELG